MHREISNVGYINVHKEETRNEWLEQQTIGNLCKKLVWSCLQIRIRPGRVDAYNS